MSWLPLYAFILSFGTGLLVSKLRQKYSWLDIVMMTNLVFCVGFLILSMLLLTVWRTT